MAPGPLEDRRPFRVQHSPVPTSPSRGVEVGGCFGEAVEGGPGPGPGQPGRTVVRGIAHHSLGQLRGELVVRDTAQQLPVEQEQVDQEGPFGHRRWCPSPLPGSCRCSTGRQAVDLGLQVRQSRHPAGGARPVVSFGQAGDDGASSAGADTAVRMALRSGGSGLGGFR